MEGLGGRIEDFFSSFFRFLFFFSCFRYSGVMSAQCWDVRSDISGFPPAQASLHRNDNVDDRHPCDAVPSGVCGGFMWHSG